MELCAFGAESRHRSFTRISRPEMSEVSGKGHELYQLRLTWDLETRMDKAKRFIN